MEKKNLYIISFGTSDKYRFYADAPEKTADCASDEIKSQLMKEFPAIRNTHFLTQARIQRIAPEDEAEYEGYKTLDADTLGRIEAHIDTEAANRQEVQQGILNAPFAEINQ